MMAEAHVAEPIVRKLSMTMRASVCAPNALAKAANTALGLKSIPSAFDSALK
jgi:hypothetical protein